MSAALAPEAAKRKEAAASAPIGDTHNGLRLAARPVVWRFLVCGEPYDGLTILSTSRETGSPCLTTRVSTTALPRRSKHLKSSTASARST